MFGNTICDILYILLVFWKCGQTNMSFHCDKIERSRDFRKDSRQYILWVLFENSFRRPYGSCKFGTSSFAHVQAVSTFFLSFYDASIVLLRNLGTTKMDPQNKCFFHANFYFKSGFWPTSLQRKIMKFA